jgi:hypothetical protein
MDIPATPPTPPTVPDPEPGPEIVDPVPDEPEVPDPDESANRPATDPNQE